MNVEMPIKQSIDRCGVLITAEKYADEKNWRVEFGNFEGNFYTVTDSMPISVPGNIEEAFAVGKKRVEEYAWVLKAKNCNGFKIATSRWRWFSLGYIYEISNGFEDIRQGGFRNADNALSAAFRKIKELDAAERE